MTWESHAAHLAGQVSHASSRWRGPVASTPRHLFVPRWWDTRDDRWTLCTPTTDEDWFAAAYSDRSLVTSVAGAHADNAEPDDHPVGLPTSSATLPSLVVRMFQYARIDTGHTLLDVGTGSGYGVALAAHRLGDDAVISVDVDPYLVRVACERLAEAGLSPRVEAVDATGPLPQWEGRFDRIVATVGVRPIPAAWLKALRTGGRLVTTIAGTSLVLTADKRADGAAVGRLEWERAGFMPARHGADCPRAASKLLAAAHDWDGEDVHTSPYPVIDVANAWDVDSMLGILAPGIEHAYHDRGTHKTAVMAHPDGSWARATETDGRTVVHQGGPRRLWEILDGIRAYWLQHGELPVRGARVLVSEDGRTRLARGTWRATL
ncbi:50S ribosomal protein L11 methyltransferase [Streptomyces sp. GXMU-J15]|uniref:Protein-L-isoaspartate O-methyltransferase n=1 Tax=Streptomyces fuscus TaxID=3048495 RepID=A0ABT7IR54_9ACTN|nr:methyltransferase domain-containing protein [Streptomyces fuscus]MDL2075055.1 50S ribosomal protein L11 methyltransferase [Streptomyces fuscus]